MRIINAPSLANCPLTLLGEQTEQLVRGGADWFHIDIMDGHYVPNLCFPARVVGELKAKYPSVAADVHLMVDDPGAYVPLLATQGADYVSFHLDAARFARRLIGEIAALGVKAGVVINPSQRIDALEPVVDIADMIVLMTVEPGFPGQKFMPEAIPRLMELTELRKSCGNPFLISIDGGVDYGRAAQCARLGAEVYVTGLYTVFNQPEGIEKACLRFRREMGSL